MMNEEGTMLQRKKIGLAAETMRELGIDLWIIVGRESGVNADPALPPIFVGDVMGTTAVLIRKAGETAAVAHKWDAEALHRQGLYDKVLAYGDSSSFQEVLKEAIAAPLPARIALNFSEQDVSADGLTVG